MLGGRFGSFEFGSREFTRGIGPAKGKRIACVHDTSDHGGHIMNSNDDNKLTAQGDIVAVEGAMHKCPIYLHGVTPVSAITTITYHNGLLILTEGAVAGCGAVIRCKNRKVGVE